MTISLYYYCKDDKYPSDEKEVVFTSIAEFNEWIRQNVEFNPDNNIYDGQPAGFTMHVGNFKIEKFFGHDVTWNELTAAFGEMTRFFRLNDDEEEIKENEND